MAAKPNRAPKHYRILWGIMADPQLSASAKCCAVALLLKFRNSETELCNPSFDTLARAVGRSRRSAIDAIAELKSGDDPWLSVKSTKGGAKANTNNFHFSSARLTGEARCTPTGAADFTGEVEGQRGEADRSVRVKRAAHELSIEPSNNYSTEAQRSEGSALPAWAKPAGNGKYFVEVESPGGDLIRRYHKVIEKPLPIVSPRQNAFIVPYVTPPGSAPVVA
ncbi:helix-turn-helix domain-containing protein [Tardiphaga sp. 285_C5_N1_2]|uniref:helix-turn-helix domain-containing protein n=1 Tax=Tardiphaga sp. 285_C5_N1_2 TaxID=3240775 RepID=UPI003F8AE9B3